MHITNPKINRIYDIKIIKIKQMYLNIIGHPICFDETQK